MCIRDSHGGRHSAGYHPESARCAFSYEYRADNGDPPGMGGGQGFFTLKRNDKDMDGDPDIGREDLTSEEERDLIRRYYDVVDEGEVRGPTPVATPVFDGATPEEVDEALMGWVLAHEDSKIKMRVNLGRPATAVSGK